MEKLKLLGELRFLKSLKITLVSSITNVTSFCTFPNEYSIRVLLNHGNCPSNILCRQNCNCSQLSQYRQ